jgi:uncharacterized protein (TIGR02453 family)
MVWTVYILRCGDGTLYTGATNDLGRRLATHARGRGGAYTRGRGPFELVYHEAVGEHGAALRCERALKRLPRHEKERLIMARGLPPAGGGRFAGFGRGALDFFKRLKRRNNKPWFEANRAVYLLQVRDPMLALVEEMDVRLARFAPEIVGDPRRSIFRINRDVRFSRDKSPYKTHAACWFYHRDAGRGVGSEGEGGAGFYFHLAPEGSSIGAGIWMPPRPALARIRAAIVEDLDGFERVVRAPAVRRRFGDLEQDAMLKRLPRGFDVGHPAGDWLRYQSFTVGRELTQREVLAPTLPRVLERDYKALTPLVRWLNSALGFGAAERRV